MSNLNPYDWGQAQFDPATHRSWMAFREAEPYVVEQGLVFLPPRRESAGEQR